MFTGLVQAICTIASVRRSADTMQMTIDIGKLAGEVKAGDSIAVNGICLTVTQLNATLASFDVSRETLSKTQPTLGRLQNSSPVNIELAMKPADRFGGHFVTGHIDGTATIKSIGRQGEFADIRFSATAELLDQMVVKGSVAVDGVSLTISDMDKSGFGTALIPQTLKATTLGRVKTGDFVNIETDIIVKTINKQLEKILPSKQHLTMDKLKKMGF